MSRGRRVTTGRIDIRVGDRYGKRRVVGPASSLPKRGQRVTVRCDCGSVDVVRVSDLRRGAARCCLSCVNVVHGHNRRARKSREWNAWRCMISRCTRPADPSWRWYGERGVRVHETWFGEGGFERFLEAVGPHPGDGFTLDRIDPHGHYEPGNVRWADASTQRQNQRGSEADETFIDDADTSFDFGWNLEAAE